VEHVLMDGKPIVQNKNHISLDMDKAQKISQAAASKLWARLENMKPQVDQIKRQ
jgi:hypothetical protein